jgi:pimeloyl-ACP methyl ester carboxylesterase
MLFPVGGPGNLLPRGYAASGFTRAMRGFTDDYTFYLTSRKSNLPEGYTTRDMSHDYADLIRQDLGGHVDLVLGHSFGGLILQHFAADHADLADHLVICGAAHKITEKAKQIDYRYAELMNQRRDREAMAQRAEAVVPGGIAHRLLYGALWLFARQLLGPIDATFRRDVLIEARAELNHDALESLKRISVPVLIVCAANDFAFRLEDVKEMAALVRGATLKVYERGHASIFMDPRFVPDVKAFTARSNPVTT